MEKVFYELSRNLSKEINIVAMSGRLAISRDTLSKYIDILENMYILKKIHS
jgi:predicted AAA+ superfamily ATPase